MATWRSIKDGMVDIIIETPDNKRPKEGYDLVPDDWGGSHGDKIEWFDGNGRRIPDYQLIEAGLRTDKRGMWYNTEKTGETKQIYHLDMEPGEGWTLEKPLDEAHQKWDGQHWVVDTGKKEAAEKQQEIAEIQNKIAEYETKLQRPLIALADPEITPEAEAEERSYYSEYAGKIKELRVQKQALLSA